jgi:hypothetical protein
MEAQGKNTLGEEHVFKALETKVWTKVSFPWKRKQQFVAVGKVAATRVWFGVARFFFEQHTKTGENRPNGHKIDQMAAK